MKINPMETAPFEHEDFDEAPSNIFVHKGAWATIIGTNDKLAGWVDTHELFADNLYRDQILTKQYTNTREPGEFGDGVTVEREDESVVAKNATTASADKLEVVEHLSCGECQGSGYGGHPDSMVNCGSCNGRGAIPLVRQSDATRIITACQQEVERLRREIDHKQKAMSSQAEQWTRSMAEAKREGMMDAATFLRDHVTISNGETLDPAIPEILKALYQNAGDHRSGDDELTGTARQ